MTNQTIAPALDAATWRFVRRGRRDIGIEPDEYASAMAIANYNLPDGHPLKITHRMIRDIYHAALALPENSPHYRAALLQYADALAALLPPE